MSKYLMFHIILYKCFAKLGPATRNKPNHLFLYQNHCGGKNEFLIFFSFRKTCFLCLCVSTQRQLHKYYFLYLSSDIILSHVFNQAIAIGTRSLQESTGHFSQLYLFLFPSMHLPSLHGLPVSLALPFKFKHKLGKVRQLMAPEGTLDDLKTEVCGGVLFCAC